MSHMQWHYLVLLLLSTFISAQDNQIRTLPWSCDFNNDDCSMTQDVAQPNNFYWIRHSGATKSHSTGPDPNDGQGYYMYMEASHRNPGDNTCLRSALLPQRSVDSCLTFKYNVHGMHIGALNVLAMYGNTNPQLLWQVIGDWEKNRDDIIWHTARVTIPASAPYFGFKAVRGGTWSGEPYGDICVDDLQLDPGPCENIIIDPNRAVDQWPDTTGPQTAPDGLAGSENANCPIIRTIQQCNFDGATELTTSCLFYNNDIVKWQHHGGSTPTGQTGPNQDYSNPSAGKYLYIEADGKTPGSVAKLTSPDLGHLGGPFCLEFVVHMFGTNIGDLRLETKDRNSNTKIIWYEKGSQGANWGRVQEILPEGTSTVSFVAILGNGNAGDMALDSIKIRYGSCGVIETCEMTPPSQPLPPPADPNPAWSCGLGPSTVYTSKSCNINQEGTNPQFKWILHKGRTPSPNTGPTVDHTVGNEQGYYMYTEVSGFENAEEAKLLTPRFPGNNGLTYCLRFWYHLFGSQMGTLSVLARTPRGDITLWVVPQQNSDQWQEKRDIVVPADTQHVIFFAKKTWGIVHEGDMAIDDLVVSKVPCSTVSQPTTMSPPVQASTPWAQQPSNPADRILKSSDIPPQNPNAPCPIVNLLQHCTFDGMPQLIPMCKFFNNGQNGGMLWQQSTMGQLPVLGPTSTTGKYLYLEKDKGTLTSELQSPDLSSFGGPFCLSLDLYFFGGSNSVELTIYRQNSQSGIFQVYLQGPIFGQSSWTTRKITIPEFTKRVILRAKRSQRDIGNIAIDNIQLHYGNCDMVDTCKEPSQNRDIRNDGNSIRNCDFEQNIYTNCPVSFETDPLKFKWSLNRGPTPTLNTGPQTDKTTYTDKGYYMFTETTGFAGGETATFNTPNFPSGNSHPYCLTFWYHLYGDDIGILRVYEVLPTGNNVIFEKSFQTGNTWLEYKGTLQAQTQKLTFESIKKPGTTVEQGRGDMAVDDLRVVKGACEQATTGNPWPTGPPAAATTPSPSVPTNPWPAQDPNPANNVLNPNDLPPQNSNPPCPIAQLLQECSFDGTARLVPGCKFFNNPGNNGMLWQQSTEQSAITGPSTNTGSYLYLEQDRPGTLLSKLDSPDLGKYGGPFCLSVDVNFYETPNSVQLVIYREADQSIAIQLRTIQANSMNTNRWETVTVTVYEFAKKVSVVARRNQQNIGNVAIDNLKLQYGSCELLSTVCREPPPSRNTPPPANSVLLCNLETNQFSNCNLQSGNPNPGEFKWLKHMGPTPTDMTGPERDKSPGTNNGYYLYTETTGFPGGAKARTYSPSIPLSSNTQKYCLSFWYHMYGDNMGTLRVFQDSHAGEKLIFQKSGPQGNIWHNEKITLDALTTRLIFEGEKKPGTTPSQSRGDMAIDDISVVNGPCEAAVTPGVTPGAVITPETGGESEITTGFEPCENRGNTVFSCGFDSTSDMCGQIQSVPQSNAVSRWSITNVPPITAIVHRNGPAGNYMFLDSKKIPENRALLQSPDVSQFQGPFTLTFWYNLFDSPSGFVSVLERKAAGQLIELMTLIASSDTVGNNWILKTMPVSGGTRNIIFSSHLPQQTSETQGFTYGVGIDTITLNTSCAGMENTFIQEQKVCTKSPCETNGNKCDQICENNPNWQGPDEYKCKCLDGYRAGIGSASNLCYDIDECAELQKACPDVNENCYNSPGSYICVKGKCAKKR